MDIDKLIRVGKGTIVDVRTTTEFMSGNVAGSVNIPLEEITRRLDEIKTFETPLVLCCASGGRSGVAQEFLTRNGVVCVNAGSWLNVNHLKSKAV